MIPILYKKSDTDYSRNGVGFLSDILTCVVTEERNGAFECSFTYPITGQHYAEISEGDIVKVKPNETSDLQLFRIYKHSKPLNGTVTFSAEHISYDANGIPLVSLTAKSTTAQAAINKAISEGAFESNFKALSDISTLNSINITEPCSLRAALGGQQGSVLDVWGGEYEFDNYTIRLHAHRGADNGVTIEYGKNLTDIRQERNITDTFTHILPYAIYTEQTDDGAGGTIDNDVIISLPEKVVSLTAAENIGHKKAFIVNLSDMFGENEEITPASLRAKTTDYINSHENLGVPKVNITASFVSLWQTEEYKNIAPLERVRLCDTVTVKFIDLGVSAKAKIIKTVYDAIGEKYNSIELGQAKSSFANTILEQNKAITELATVVRKGFSNVSEETKKAIAEATALITGNAGGYVVLHPAKQPQEILILDTPDIETAVHVWRWNASGLGYSSTGYNGEFGLAMTMNGAIVADFITVGTLNGALLKADSVQANAISAGFKQEISDEITGAKNAVEQDFKLADEQLRSSITTSYTDAINAAEGRTQTLIQQTKESIELSVSSTYTTKTEFGSTVSSLQSSISQNAENISLKVSKGGVISEINQSSDTITLTAGRLIITTGNFKLNSAGSVTASNVTLDGSLKTTTSDNSMYTHIHDGTIETFYNNKRIMTALTVGTSTVTQYAILGSGNYGGIAIGAIYNSGIETYYRCNIQDAYTEEGCRHKFVGTVAFEDKIVAHMNFNSNISILWNGYKGIGYETSSFNGLRSGLWIGSATYNTCITGNGVYIYGDPMITGELRFLDQAANQYTTAMWADWYNNALNVGNNSRNLWLKGTNIYANGSAISTSSDERRKHDIQPLDAKYLDIIKSISPVSFKYNDDIAVSGRTHTGFIAQDVFKSMTAAGISTEEFAAYVDLNGDGKEYALRYEEFIALLLLYSKHLEKRIETLEMERAG